jgi:hypothetical protein
MIRRFQALLALAILLAAVSAIRAEVQKTAELPKTKTSVFTPGGAGGTRPQRPLLDGFDRRGASGRIPLHDWQRDLRSVLLQT